jgi:hypothetical protein
MRNFNDRVAAPRRLFMRLAAGAMMLATAGCAGFGEGVGRSVLSYVDGSGAPPDGFCRIEGWPFAGVADVMARADGADGRQSVRLLIVHGIGPHDDNYSLRLSGMIAQQLGLDHRDPRQKRIHLANAPAKGAGAAPVIGRLLVTRFADAEQKRELIAFEVNWSDLNRNTREAFVSADADIDRVRASINASMKTFINRQMVDPIRYIGDQSPLVHDNVRLGACWMISGSFDEYPDASGRAPATTSTFCPAIDDPARAAAVLASDEFVAVTHSLGSRIFLDAFSAVGEYVDADRADKIVNPFVSYATAFSDKAATVFMLSNQLTLLQLGLDSRTLRAADGAVIKLRNSERWPGVDAAAFCEAGGSMAPERRFGRLSVVAVSDPNDLLSYRIPAEFADDYVDRRLCARITNATIEIAPKRDVLGLSFADPMTAHNAYWSDPRVAALIVEGFAPVASTHATASGGNPCEREYFGR